MNVKSSGTFSCRVPSGSLTISSLPSTAITWNVLVSVVWDVVCAGATAAVRRTIVPNGHHDATY